MWHVNGAYALELIFAFITIQSATSLLNSHHRSLSFGNYHLLFKYKGSVSERFDVVSTESLSGELKVDGSDVVSKKVKKNTVSAEKRAHALRATQAAAEIAVETNKIYNGDKDVAEDNVSVPVKVVAKKGRKAVKPKLPTPRERTGLNFTGRDKASGDLYEYDVPFIDTPRWLVNIVIVNMVFDSYELQVSNTSQKKLREKSL
jgi:hypothetical protein